MSLRTLLGFATVAAALAMAACTTTPTAEAGADDAPRRGGAKCNADPVQWAVGQAGDQATMGRVWRESGAGLIRPIGPNQAVTMDYRGDRVNVHLDKDNKIIRITCG